MWSKHCQLSLPLHWGLHAPGMRWEDADFHGPHSPEGGDSGAGLPLSLSLAVSDLL